MDHQTIALAAVFNRRHEVLLLKRPADVHCAGLWSFPGGKLEPGEAALPAAMRELKEEAGLCAEHWQQLGEAEYDYQDRALRFVLFACCCADVSSLSCESEHAWVSRDALGGFPMPDANARLVPMLLAPEMDEYLETIK